MDRKLECQYCHKEFNRPCALAIHERTCRSNPNRIPLENHICNFPHNAKPDGWKCDICQAIFHTRNELTHHRRELNHNTQVHQKNLYKCSYCNKQWETTIEVPYNKAYSDEFRNSLCKLLDGFNVDISTFNYKYECVNIHERAAIKRKEHNDKLEAASKNRTLDKNGRLSGNKIAIDELNRRKELILNSGVDLTKFGWVERVSEITGLSIRVIHTTVDKFDDLKSKVFRRGN